MIDDIIRKIRCNYEQNKKFTVLHCYLSVSNENIRLDRKGKVQIKMKCGSFLPIENLLSSFHANRLIVWAVLDCDRVQAQVARTMGTAAGGNIAWSDNEDEKESGHEAASSVVKHGTIFTFAAK